MKISLLHPSRGRPEKSIENVLKWVKLSGTNPFVDDLELILSIDKDDPSNSLYTERYRDELGWESVSYQIVTSPNTCVVEATNVAGKHATGDILVYSSDDFDCFENWGQAVIKEFENENRPLCLRVDDMLQPRHAKVITMPIMNRALYEKLGYFWHPEYKSMFVDCDLFETVWRLKAFKDAYHLKFEHHHPAAGKAQQDETYKRSAAHWDQGQRLFNMRRRRGFPI